MKIKDLLTDESKWTKFANARNDDGDVVPDHHGGAVSRCLVGALRVCYRDAKEQEKVRAVLQDAIQKRVGSCSIVEFNDRDEVFFADVRALIEEVDV